MTLMNIHLMFVVYMKNAVVAIDINSKIRMKYYNVVYGQPNHRF